MPSGRASATVLVGDIGSTFTKLAAVGPDGEVEGYAKTPTAPTEIVAGVDRAVEASLRELGDQGGVGEIALSSSAGGGLRVVVLGLERKLTLEAGLRTSATAGARVVASYAGDELQRETPEGFAASAPDLALLTGGTNGGETRSLLDTATALRRLAPELPVVVAGNDEAREAVSETLGAERLVRFAGNVMPRVGELDSEEAQTEIREVFVEHVIGRGRFAMASPVARAIRMPTPAAVLAAAETLAGSGREPFERPVVVDVGGATTDVHSVLPLDDSEQGYAASGISPQAVTRTVEGDLGMRENACSLIAAARRDGYSDELTEGDLSGLEDGAWRRSQERGLVPDNDREFEIDERLAELATAIALQRHAGVLRTTLTPTGALLRKTGRDLRASSCVIATGGVFQHSPRAESIVSGALRRAHARGVLVAPDVPVFVDRSYLLWAAGLLRAERADTAARLASATLTEADR